MAVEDSYVALPGTPDQISNPRKIGIDRFLRSKGLVDKVALPMPRWTADVHPALGSSPVHILVIFLVFHGH